MSDPGKKHWEAVKGILRYLSGTKDMCICFGKSNSGVLGYTDSDYAGNSHNRRPNKIERDPIKAQESLK